MSGISSWYQLPSYLLNIIFKQIVAISFDIKSLGLTCWKLSLRFFNLFNHLDIALTLSSSIWIWLSRQRRKYCSFHSVDENVGSFTWVWKNINSSCNCLPVVVFLASFHNSHRIIIEPTRTATEGDYNGEKQDKKSKTEIEGGAKNHFLAPRSLMLFDYEIISRPFELFTLVT